MDGRDWKLFLLPYEQAVEELKIKFRALRSELKAKEEFAPIEFVTGRVKRISSILEKAQRMNISLDKLETEMEDIAGIRIMCQFVEDIARVAAIIRARRDMRLVNEKDYITHNKESGYRSYHMILEYPVQMADGVKTVLAEVQIRTLAMNFWATIEHSLNYKYRTSLPEEIRIRLKKAAEAAFTLDNEMSNIREEIIASQKIFEAKSNVVSSVLEGIRELYLHRRNREADDFQLEFNRLWREEDLAGLQRLDEEIQRLLLQIERK